MVNVVVAQEKKRSCVIGRSGERNRQNAKASMDLMKSELYN